MTNHLTCSTYALVSSTVCHPYVLTHCLAAASTNAPEVGNFWQRQAMAVPADYSDPLLKKWVKSPSNPFLLQVNATRVGNPRLPGALGEAIMPCPTHA